MKKLLALVLALVMVMGLATVSTSATTFTDDADIDHQEAVEVMNALDIINGMGDGKFDPNGNVTRAQMAKMVTIALLGDVEVSAFTGTATDLKDVGGHWAEGYIKYCYSQGIISGRGNGIFDPNANVTTAEASKMLLVALGYNSDVRKYTGDQWAINVARDAQQRGLYEKIENLTSNKAMDRDDAAQMIYNTLTANSIVPTETYNSDGTISTTYATNGTPLLTKTFKAKEYVGVLTEDDTTYTSSSKKYYYNGAGAAPFENKANNADVHGGNPFVSKTDYTAYLGEEVTVVVSTASNGDETVINIAPTGKSKVVETAQSAIEAVSGKTDQVKIDGTTYDLEGGLNSTGLVDTNSYDLLKLVDSDDNGKLDIRVTTTVLPAKVTYVSSTEIIAGATYKFADNNIASGLAKDDYVSIVKDRYTEKYTIEKIDALEGKVEATKSTPARVRVSGVWYNDEGSTVVTPSYTTTMALNNSYKFYVVNGVVCAADTTGSNDLNNVVVVIDKDTSSLNKQALILKANGTTETVALDMSGANPTLGGFYKFEETSKGYKFTALTDGDTLVSGGTTYTYVDGEADQVTKSDGTTVTDGTAIGAMGVGGASKAIADNAVVFVYGTNDHSGKVITGKQLKNLTLKNSGNADGYINSDTITAAGFLHSTTNGLARVTYASVQTSKVDELGIVSGNKTYAYVTEANFSTVIDGTTYQTYKIWNGTDNLTVFEKGSTARPQGEIFYYDAIDSDSIITGVTVLNIKDEASISDITSKKEVGAIQGIDGKKLYIDGTTDALAAKLTDSTKYLYIDSNADEAEEIGLAAGEVVLADKSAGIFRDNVVVVVNASDEITLLVVDAKNAMTYTGTHDTNAQVKNDVTMTGLTSDFTGATASKTTAVKKGEVITITVKMSSASATLVSKTITLTNAKYVDGSASGSSTIVVPALTAGASYTYTIVADGVGDISFACANT